MERGDQQGLSKEREAKVRKKVCKSLSCRPFSLGICGFFLLFQIEFPNGDENGAKGKQVGNHGFPSAYENIVGDPEKAGGEGDDPKETLVFHAVGNGGEKLCRKGQEGDKAVPGKHPQGDDESGKSEDDGEGGFLFLHQFIKEKAP